MLNVLKNSEGEYLNLPAKVNSGAVSNMADQLNATFVSEDQQLELALKLIGLDNIEQLLSLIGGFFIKNIKLRKLTLEEARKIDFKKLTYQFLKENGIQKPVFENEGQKAMVIDIYFQLGRAYIHNILMPALAKINPQLAYAVLNELKLIVRSVSIDQGVSPNSIVNRLLLDDIEIPLQKKLISPVNTQAVFMMPNLIGQHQIRRLGQQLLEEYEAIYKATDFTNIIVSGGADMEPMRIHNDKLKLIAHLFYRMYTPYDQNHRSLIKMSKGKAYWEFLQQNIIDGKTLNTCTNRIRKINNELMKDSNDEYIIQSVDAIIKPIYKEHYPNSTILISS